MTDIIVTPNYASINGAVAVAEAWINLWSGDEWGEGMEKLAEAAKETDILGDEDCVTLVQLLWKNLQAARAEFDEDAESVGMDRSDAEIAEAVKEAQGAATYWSNGGNLGQSLDGQYAKAGKATIDSLPAWATADHVPQGEDDEGSEEDLTLLSAISKYGHDRVWDAALRGGLLHGTEDEDQDPYK